MSTEDDSPEAVYTGQVSTIIAAEHRESTYVPAAPVELFVRSRRTPTSLRELDAIEQRQLERMFRGQDIAKVLETGMMEEEDDSLDLEVAVVVDQQGELRHV